MQVQVFETCDGWSSVGCVCFPGGPLRRRSAVVSVWESEREPAQICSEPIPADDQRHGPATGYLLPDYCCCPQILLEGMSSFLGTSVKHDIMSSFIRHHLKDISCAVERIISRQCKNTKYVLWIVSLKCWVKKWVFRWWVKLSLHTVGCKLFNIISIKNPLLSFSCEFCQHYKHTSTKTLTKLHIFCFGMVISMLLGKL